MLQYSGVQGFKTVLQYSLLGSSVLQYTALYCGWKGCRRPGCIAIQPGVSWHETRLPVSQDRQPCRDTAGVGTGARRRGRWGAQAWALGRAGRQVRGRERACERWRARGDAQATGAQGRAERRQGVCCKARQSSGGRDRRAAWALGARAGHGLCTRCTQPVFGLV